MSHINVEEKSENKFQTKLIYFKIPSSYFEVSIVDRSRVDPSLRLRIVNVILIELSQRLPLSIMNEYVRSTISHMLDGLLWAPSILLHKVAPN